MRERKQSAIGCVNMSHRVLDFHLFSSRSVSISSELFPADLSVPKEGRKPLWTELSCKIRHVPAIGWALSSAPCFLPQKLTSLYECEHSQTCGIIQRETENVLHLHLELFRKGGAELQRSSSRESLIQFSLIEAAQVSYRMFPVLLVSEKSHSMHWLCELLYFIYSLF